MLKSCKEKNAVRPGYYGKFGGCFAPEVLIAPLAQLERSFEEAVKDASFLAEYHDILRSYAGRPTALTRADRFAGVIGRARVYLKREDLLHTGAHKLNNALGQCMLAKRAGKTRILAETGAGQHGVAVATACAKLELACTVYMGAEDMRRQAPNVEKIKLLGAEVKPVDAGQATLKDAINEALRDWSENYEHSHYCIGSALGPRPYPAMVRFFQSVIGIETRRQVLDELGRLPDLLVACVGGGSNAIGLFAPFLDKGDNVGMIGVEAGGRLLQGGLHAARFATGTPGVLHGSYTYMLQTADGQTLPTHSISAGLDYPAVGPEHAMLFESGRVRYECVSDEEAVDALHLLSRTEGIIPALESSHALAYVMRSKSHHDDEAVVINLSGRGDKDLPALAEAGLLGTAGRSA